MGLQTVLIWGFLSACPASSQGLLCLCWANRTMWALSSSGQRGLWYVSSCGRGVPVSMNRFWSCWQLYTQMACLFDSWLRCLSTQKISTQISVCWAWQNVHHWWLGSYCCTHCRWPQTSVAVDGLRWQRTFEFPETEGSWCFSESVIGKLFFTYEFLLS